VGAGETGGAKRLMTGKETKIFDPAEGFSPLTDAVEITDSTVTKRGDQWWMYVAGQATGHEGIRLFSASLPAGSPLSAQGWSLTPDCHDPARIALLAGHESSKAWDLKGGRHCPAYVRGWDPEREKWVERIYYAGGAANLWGPYAIGYLEWDGKEWVDQPESVFIAEEDWEHGSVYEPNLLYADGKWKMWYVAGSNVEDYLVQGFAESADGRNWSGRKIFIPPEEKIFDFCVINRPQGYEAVFSKVWLGKTPAPVSTGLWWCECPTPSSDFKDWSKPRQIMDATNCGWHAGPWKPSVRYEESDPTRMFVFFDGGYVKENEPGGFPFAFTLGCLEIERPG
jgi:hypothetical protein